MDAVLAIMVKFTAQCSLFTGLTVNPKLIKHQVSVIILWANL
jgi:hypothetical protein